MISPISVLRVVCVLLMAFVWWNPKNWRRLPRKDESALDKAMREAREPIDNLLSLLIFSALTFLFMFA